MPGVVHMEDGPRENTRPPDSSTEEMHIDNSKANENQDVALTRVPCAISSS